MSRIASIFEVRVLVKNDNGKKYYSVPIGQYINDKYENRDAVRMFHIEARTHRLALEKGKKYGHPLTARKAARVDTWLPELAKTDITPDVLQLGNNRALAIDEMVWVKRNNRRKNLAKDKEGY